MGLLDFLGLGGDDSGGGFFGGGGGESGGGGAGGSDSDFNLGDLAGDLFSNLPDPSTVGLDLSPESLAQFGVGSSGGGGFDLSTFDFGSLFPPAGAGAGLGAGLAPPLDTSIPISLGGSMDPLTGLDFSGSTAVAVRGIPWGTITRMFGAAVRYFGAPFIMPIAGALANYFTARLGKPVTSQEILLRYLKKKGRRRGSRGITGRQLSITRTTIRKVNRMHALIASIARVGGGHRSAPRAAPRRRRAA